MEHKKIFDYDWCFVSCSCTSPTGAKQHISKYNASLRSFFHSSQRQELWVFYICVLAKQSVFGLSAYNNPQKITSEAIASRVDI